MAFPESPDWEHTLYWFPFYEAPAARLCLVIFGLCLPEAMTTKGCCSSTLCHLVSVPCPLLPSLHLWYLFYSCLLFGWTLLFSYTWVLFVIFAFCVTGVLWDIKSC